MVNKVKDSGEIFTPDFLVSKMLDFVGYQGDSILQKHVIDHSAGDGAFMVQIVERYCAEYTGKSLRSHLEKYIHGIELDRDNHTTCINRLDSLAAKHGAKKVKWDIRLGNALDITDYNGKMDFVVGNPPYVRVHNLGGSHKQVKSHLFSSSGMTDLYITFYEISFNMLSATGKMCLITPSSFLTSSSGLHLRQYIEQCSNLVKIIDLGHAQPFENATTYTVITMFDRTITTRDVQYFVYDEASRAENYVDTINYTDFYIGGKIYLGTTDKLQYLRQVTGLDVKTNAIQVKNGFATLADPIFIGSDIEIDDSLVIDVLKASTGQWKKCIFPYINGKPVSEAKLRSKHSAVYEYLITHKDKLLGRSISNPDEWYLFGRSQAIGDVGRKKYAINTLIRDKRDIKFQVIEPGQGVYSGLYILFDGDEQQLRSAICSDDFANYIRSLKKYKSGGYYTFSSKDVRNFLVYTIYKTNNELGDFVNEQQSLFGRSELIVSNIS